MTSVKCSNSGVASKAGSFIKLPKQACAFRAPVSSCSSRAHLCLASSLAGQFRIRHAATDNLFHDMTEPLGVSGLAVVIAERLFIDVAEQVEWFDADIRAVQAAFEQAPEVLHGVGVNVLVHVLNGMIDNSMLIISAQAVVRLQFISEDRRSSFNVLTDLLLQFRLATILYNHCADVSAALYHAEDHRLILTAGPSDDALTLGGMHIASLLTDEGLVYFDFATKLVKTCFLHRKTDAVVHEPSGLLSNLQSPMEFVRTDTVFATSDQPYSTEPLFKGDWRVLEYRAGLQRERGACMFGIALPHTLFRKPCELIRSAARALHDTIGPAQSNHELAAMVEVREPEDCVSESIWRFHVMSMRRKLWNVKYVIALARTMNPLTATIGGVPATVNYAGLAPGFPDLYQVNLVVPAGVNPGSAVVVLTIAGQSSPPVTLPVQ